MANGKFVGPLSEKTSSNQSGLRGLEESFVKDGLTRATAARSALELKQAYGYNTDGVYWINLPVVGPTQVYCIMNSAVGGGGWMMAMKATRGTTFNYDSELWTTNTYLNQNDNTRNDADAKFQTMNYHEATDIMAIWPDMGATGGSVTVSGYSWTWIENNFNNGVKKTLTNFFATTTGTSTFGGTGLFKQDAKTFAGWGGAGKFSGQTDVRFYGFNYNPHPAYGSTAKVRWGFGWNENGEGLYPGIDSPYKGTNDVSGGIGMSAGWGSYSAGDYIACCQDTTGINRSARVEVYVR
jgi:hypothetical protein